MLLIRKKAYARAALIGNPSDGYFGRTIALLVRNFWAEVTLYEWDQIELILSQEDRSRFDSIGGLAQDVRLHGYYGGIRLVKATIKRFCEYCRTQRIALHEKNFSIRYQSTIPRQLGLAGSSAIIVATLRCLIEFYAVEIPRETLPSLALSVETEELGIAAGLQDRVIQVYEGLVYMDFARERMQTFGGLPCGVYEPLEPGLLPALYLAFRADASEPTEVVHNNLRNRFLHGEAAVLDAMRRLAELTVEGRAALLARDSLRLASLVDQNFELRRSICRIAIPHLRMVEVARACGASAHFAGSGGAILGTYPDETVFARLERELGQIGCRVIRPVVCGT
jgi:glucuronokinase